MLLLVLLAYFCGKGVAIPENGENPGVIPTLEGPDNTTVTILLDEKNIQVNNVVFLKQFELLAATKATITVENRLPNPDDYFYYIQVHSYLHELVLSWNENYTGSAYERGSNIGRIFYSDGQKPAENKTIFLFNEKVNHTAALMVVLLVYEANRAFIPGACPLGQKNHTIPSLSSILSEDDLRVTWSPGKKGRSSSCDSPIQEIVNYEIRYFYLGKNEYSPQLYFDTIMRFIRGDQALEFGYSIAGKVDPDHPFRRIFARYAGMGLFYTVVMVSNNTNSIPISYVPGVSYGCPGTVESDQVHCDLIDNIAAKVIYIIIMLLGIGVIIFGRGLLFVRTMVYSFMIGGFILYVVYSITPSPFELKIGTTSLIGILMVLWWTKILLTCNAMYRITDFMAAIILGYTLSCLILYGSADAEFLTSSWHYALVLLAGILLITLWFFLMLAACGVVAINVFVGSVFVVLTLLFIFDGNLQYAFVNNWRRIKVADFRFAIYFPHLVAVDWISIVLFVVMFLFGMCFQGKCRGCCSISRDQNTRIFRDPEQRPLIARISSRGGSDDVFLSPHSNRDFLRSLP